MCLLIVFVKCEASHVYTCVLRLANRTRAQEAVVYRDGYKYEDAAFMDQGNAFTTPIGCEVTDQEKRSIPFLETANSDVLQIRHWVLGLERC